MKNVSIEVFIALKKDTRSINLEFDNSNLKELVKNIKKEDLKKLLIKECLNVLDEEINLLYNDLFKKEQL